MKVLILVLCASVCAWAQDDELFKPVKWIARTSVGSNVEISPLKGGFITDQLTGYQNKSYNWQFISSAYFFSNWGIELSATGNFNKDARTRENKFEGDVNKRYSDNYYVTFSSGITSDQKESFFFSAGKIVAGPVYKIEKNRWLLVGRILLGAQSTTFHSASVILKTKGTNEFTKIDWTPSSAGGSFVVNPSFTLGYRISRIIILNVDVNYWIYRINNTYTERTEDMNSGQVSNQFYRYNHVVGELTFGVGVMFVIK